MVRAWIIFAFCAMAGVVGFAQSPPKIEKLGTIDCDMVEATPFVFHNALFRLEYIRDNYAHNTSGHTYFRIVDVASSNIAATDVLPGHHLGCAFVDRDTIYVYAVTGWGADHVDLAYTTDMKTWKTGTALNPPGWSMFNTSVCRGPDGYVMAIEIDKPKEEAGVPFTARFAKSKDLLNWELTPPEFVYSKDKYSACPTLRFYDGYFYMVYLDSYPGAWEPGIVRSKDLKSWEASPRNPIMKHSDEDRKIANKNLTDAEKKRIATADNANNSDLDFTEFNGKTIIYYSWGNQMGIEHLAQAEYAGSEKTFLTSFFPAGDANAQAK